MLSLEPGSMNGPGRRSGVVVASAGRVQSVKTVCRLGS